jgi:DNA polymerase-1
LKVVLLDGYNLLYRAAHSGFCRDRDKQDVDDRRIVFSFFRSLRPLMEKLRPDIAVFVLEGKPVRRLATREDYKATRAYLPDPSFTTQAKVVSKMLASCFPFRVVRHPGLECDDVIANLVRYEYANAECVIVSSDTDFLQLINDRCRVYNPIRKEYINPPVAPEDYVKYKSLVGDTADNVPGFKGVGPKTAARYVNDPELLQEFLAKAPGRAAKLAENISMIGFHDLPESLRELESHHGTLDKVMVKEAFTRHDFVSIIRDGSWHKWIATFDRMAQPESNR